MYHDFGRVAPDSINKEHHHEGELLWLFLSCGNNPVTFKQVVAQVVWENEKETNEEFAKNWDSLADHRASQKTLLEQYKQACDAYTEFTRGQYNKAKASRLKRKRDALYSRLNDTRKDIREAKWKKQYLQAFLDKESLEKLEEIRSQEDPPNSDDDTDPESSNSSHGDANDQSSSPSEADETIKYGC